MIAARRLVMHSTAPLLAISISAATNVVASPMDEPETPLLAQAEPVPDHELASVRGRFAAGGTVAYFGVEMISQLKTASGEILQGQLELSADLSGSNPDVAFQPTASIQAASDTDQLATDNEPSGQVDIGGDPGQETEGVIQSIQVAGSGNGADNRLRINVVRDGGGRASARDASGGSNIVARDSAGNTVNISRDAGNLAIDLEAPGAGRVSQRLAERGIQQLIQLRGDGHQASSLAQIEVHLQEQSGGANALRDAINDARALRQ